MQFCRKDLLKRHVGRLHPQEAENPEPWAAGAPSQNAPQDSQPVSVSNPNFDSVLDWCPTTPNFGTMQCQPTTIPFDVSNTINIDIDNLMTDIYYCDSLLDFQGIDTLATPPSTSQIDIANAQSAADLQRKTVTQLAPATIIDKCNKPPEVLARGTFDVSESKRIELISAILEVGLWTFAYEFSVYEGY